MTKYSTSAQTLKIESLLSSILRGSKINWPVTPGNHFQNEFLKSSRYHGVQHLINERFTKIKITEAWVVAISKACRQSTIGRAMWELRHQALLRKLLGKLAEENIKPILFKGTALAYELYSSPVLRSRGDTDLIVPLEDREKAMEILEAEGFQWRVGVSGDFVSYQASFVRSEPNFDRHCVDLHWRINNSQVLARLFSYEELYSRAQALPALSDHAIAVGPVDALLLACMHRAVHNESPLYMDGEVYRSGDRLIWLYDIHLLVNEFTDSDWDLFTSIATQKGLLSVCMEGMEKAYSCYGTELKKKISNKFVNENVKETPCEYLSSTGFRRAWLNFCAIDGVQAKLRYLRENIFPPNSYMVYKYSSSSLRWLPWLYLRRTASYLGKCRVIRKL